MSLKVLIVDDEVKVCQLIYHLVDWQDMGFEVAAILHDGVSAKEYIMEHTPDIVITDIKMPNCDGLELIRQVKEIHPDINFIIISGYNNFEYAKNAIHYGVEDYLLKPLEKKEIVATLEKIREKRNYISEQKTKESRWRDLAESSRERVKNSLISEMILNPEETSLQDIEAVNKEFRCDFVKGYFGMMKIQPFMRGHIISDEELGVVLFKIEQMLKERLEPCSHELIMKVSKPCVWCLINTQEFNWDEIKKQLKKMRLDILNLKNIFRELKVYISIGSIEEDLSVMYDSMRKADLVMKERVLRPEEYILECQDIRQDSRKAYDIIDGGMRSILSDYIEHFDLDGLRKEMSLLEERIQNDCRSGSLIYDCYCEVVDIFLRIAANFKGEYSVPDKQYFLALYDTFLEREEIFPGLAQKMCEIIEEYTEHKQMADAKPIRIAKKYIADHYNRQLSLEMVSAEVGFNPAYFSSLFKKETGKNFMEYVMELRIHNAKQLLVSTDYSLVEVAEEVGYSEIKYFSKIFKRVTGLTPSEYRKLYS